MRDKPKIICTLGTTTDDKDVLRDMVRYGMNCARINTAYAGLPEYAQRIRMVREIADIPIMLDLKGPQVRLHSLVNYRIRKGDRLIIGFKDEPLAFSLDFYDDIGIDDRIYFENGTIESVVTNKADDRTIDLDILEPGEGTLRNLMGVNVPGKYLNVPRLNGKDRAALNFAANEHIEHLALSFVQDPKDVLGLYRLAEGLGYRPKICAKIEDRIGIERLPATIAEAKREGICLSVMVARGDMGIELPYYEVPKAQQGIIRTCKDYNIPVVVATEMLESMRWNSRPSRAEVADVALAALQGADAVMLSGETSNSRHPAAAVRAASEILRYYSNYNK